MGPLASRSQGKGPGKIFEHVARQYCESYDIGWRKYRRGRMSGRLPACLLSRQRDWRGSQQLGRVSRRRWLVSQRRGVPGPLLQTLGIVSLHATHPQDGGPFEQFPSHKSRLLQLEQGGAEVLRWRLVHWTCAIPREIIQKPSEAHDWFRRIQGSILQGQRIWVALINHLLQNGMNLAENALLTGCSAGGLASIIHCDEFREMMPQATNVKCLSDAGFFINVADISGARTIEAAFKKVVQMQNMTENLPRSCTSRMEPSLCFFPENLIADVKTPFFLLNPAYDSWQFTNVLVPLSADPTGKWTMCRNSFRSCSATDLQSQLEDLGNFRAGLLARLAPILGVEKDGFFIDSCFLHCQQTSDMIWQRGPEINNTSVGQAVGDWYLGRASSKLIDGPSDANLTCKRWP